MTRKLGDLGQDVTACVFPANAIAVRMFRRIGFEMVDRRHFLHIEAKSV